MVCFFGSSFMARVCFYDWPFYPATHRTALATEGVLSQSFFIFSGLWVWAKSQSLYYTHVISDYIFSCYRKGTPSSNLSTVWLSSREELVVSVVTRPYLPCDLWAWTSNLAVFFNEFLRQALEVKRKLHFGFLRNSSNLFNATKCIGWDSMNNRTPFIQDESRNTTLLTHYTSFLTNAKENFIS